jgi:hypothetical protein
LVAFLCSYCIANVRLGRKYFMGANALAYFVRALVTKKKVFMTTTTITTGHHLVLVI